MREILHVVMDKDGWLVREEDGHALLGHFYTQNEAVESAREFARKHRPRLLVVHGRYGEIQLRDTYAPTSVPRNPG